MKKIVISLLCMGAVFNACADNARDSYYSSGYTMGLNVGESYVSLGSNPPYNQQTQNIAGRIYMGYNFNPNVSLEFGYARIGEASYVQQDFPTININTRDFDALVGLHFPMGEGFSTYAKIGGALLNSTYSSSPLTQTQNGNVLAYSAGFDYAFANIGGLHSVIDWYHTDEFNTNTFDIPAQNLFSLGVYYQF